MLVFPYLKTKHTISHSPAPTKILSVPTDINLVNAPHCDFAFAAILDLLFLPEGNSYKNLFYKGRVL